MSISRPKNVSFQSPSSSSSSANDHFGCVVSIPITVFILALVTGLFILDLYTVFGTVFHNHDSHLYTCKDIDYVIVDPYAAVATNNSSNNGTNRTMTMTVTLPSDFNATFILSRLVTNNPGIVRLFECVNTKATDTFTYANGTTLELVPVSESFSIVLISSIRTSFIGLLWALWLFYTLVRVHSWCESRLRLVRYNKYRRMNNLSSINSSTTTSNTIQSHGDMDNDDDLEELDLDTIEKNIDNSTFTIEEQKATTTTTTRVQPQDPKHITKLIHAQSKSNSSSSAAAATQAAIVAGFQGISQ